MNVEREIAAANRRIRAQIDRGAREALISIGVDVEAEERTEAERRRREALAPFEALGSSWRAAADALAAMGAVFRRGFNVGDL